MFIKQMKNYLKNNIYKKFIKKYFLIKYFIHSSLSK